MTARRRASRERRLRVQLGNARACFHDAVAVLGTFPNVVAIGVGVRKRRKRIVPEACFVVEVSRKTSRARRRLPKTYRDIPVDVQLRAPLELCAGPGSTIETIGHGEIGRAGFVARDDSGKRYAVTAMHVLARDVIPTELGPQPGMNIRLARQPKSVEGSLSFGAFDAERDLAIVELTANEHLSSSVGNTNEPFLDVVELKSEDVPLRVGIVIDDAVYHGWITAYPVDHIEPTDIGELIRFVGLAKFEFHTLAGEPVELQEGWSGSAIYKVGSFAPLALLSMRDGGHRNGYGFPIHGAMRDHNLRVWR